MAGARGEGLDRSMSDARFRAFAETVPDAILTVAADGRVVFVNPAAESMFGYHAAQIVGEPVQRLVPERGDRGDHAQFSRSVQTAGRWPVGATLEVTARRSDGREFPIELSLGASGAGADRTTTAVIRDLTDRRRHARHLSAQLAVTAVLAGGESSDETAPLIVEALTRALDWDVGALWLVDDGGTLKLRHLWQARPAATRAFSDATLDPAYDPHAGLPGVTLSAGVPEWYDDLTRASGFVRRESALASGLRGAVCLPLLSEGATFGVIECFTREQMPVDAELRDLLMTVASQVGEHLQRLRAQEGLARARAELERSNTELQQFADIAAHDLRSPLRTIAGFSDLLIRRRGTLSDEEEAEFLDMIKDAADAGSSLLEHLLSYARVGGTLDLGEVDVQVLVQDVVRHLNSEITERRATLDVGDLPVVVADGVQLAQVLQNLIGNAIKFAPAGRVPVVSVTGREHDDAVQVSVTDNGAGVNPDDVPRLFEMFGRGADTNSKGTGIGLAVCAKIVARHGGRLWVEPAEGGGSVFSFTLPRRPGAPPRPRHGARAG